MSQINQHTPLVSIIIPSFNGEKFIEKTIKSVLSQTYKNWELIIIDDKSSDNTTAIIKKYLSDKIKLICHPINQGIAKTKNDGIKTGTGDFVAFLDQDDIWLKNKLELQIEAFSKSKTNLGAVCCGMIFFDDIQKTITNKFIGFNGTREAIIKQLYFKPVHTSSIFIAKRSILLEFGLFDEELRGWDDYDILMKIGTKYDIQYIKRYLVIKRMHDNNAQKLEPVMNEYSKILKRALNYHTFLKPYKNKKEANLFCKHGVSYLKTNNKIYARMEFRNSLRKSPFSFLSYFGFYISFLPNTFFQFLITIKKSVLSFSNFK